VCTTITHNFNNSPPKVQPSGAIIRTAEGEKKWLKTEKMHISEETQRRDSACYKTQRDPEMPGRTLPGVQGGGGGLDVEKKFERGDKSVVSQ